MRFFLAFLLIAVALAAPIIIQKPVSARSGVDLTDCSSPDAHGKLEEITFSPNPPVKGDNLVVATGTLDKQVTGGNFEIVVDFMGLKIDHDANVCGTDVWKLPLGMGTVTSHLLNCPEGPGDFTITIEMNLSSKVPSGAVTASIYATDQDGEELTCFEASMTLSRSGEEEIVAEPVEDEVASGVELNDCSSPDAHGSLDEIAFTPNPPVKGDNLVIATGTLDKQITGGNFEIVVDFMGLKIDHDANVCGTDVWKLPLGMGTVTSHLLNCPEGPGDFTITIEMNLSSKVPSGAVTASIYATDQDGEELTCFEASMTLSRASEPVVALPKALGSVELNDCSSADASGTVTDISFTPDPPVKGKNVLIAQGDLGKKITDGEILIVIEFMGIELDHRTNACGVDVWELPLNFGSIKMTLFDCPAQGAFEIRADINLSPMIPNGPVTAHIFATDQDGEEITCFEASFDLN